MESVFTFADFAACAVLLLCACLLLAATVAGVMAVRETSRARAHDLWASSMAAVFVAVWLVVKPTLWLLARWWTP